MTAETKNYFVGDRADWSKTPFQAALNYGRDADAHNTRTRIRITPAAEFLLTRTRRRITPAAEKDGSGTETTTETIQEVKGTSIWPGSGLTLTIMVEQVSGGTHYKVGDEIVATIKEEHVCNKNAEVPACLNQPNLADQQMIFGVGCSIERCLNVEGGECYFPIKAEEYIGRGGNGGHSSSLPKLSTEMAGKLEEWMAAKRQRDFETADQIRSEMREAGVNPEEYLPQTKKREIS